MYVTASAVGRMIQNGKRNFFAQTIDIVVQPDKRISAVAHEPIQTVVDGGHAVDVFQSAELCVELLIEHDPSVNVVISIKMSAVGEDDTPAQFHHADVCRGAVGRM